MSTRYFTIADVELLADVFQQGPAGERRILIEGDSWASYPLPSTGNLAHEVRVPRTATAVLNLAWVGDRISRMSQGDQFALFRRLVHDNQWGYTWDLIFLVGGGNDLIGWVWKDTVIKPARRTADPQRYVDAAVFESKLATLRGFFRRYINARNASEINAGTPILVQTYDYIQPRNQPPTILGIAVRDKPWIYPKLQKMGIADPGVQRGVVKILIDGLAAMLLQLADEADNFHVADTRGTLELVGPDYRRRDGDWRDEMHPSAKGYKKLADGVINPAIGALVR